MSKKAVKTKNTKVKDHQEAQEALENQGPTEKEKLLALYDQLNSLGIRSISDLENLIAKAE